MQKWDNLRIYELLGAKFFQKLVFTVEKIKFMILDKLCPNSQYLYEKYCDVKCKKTCEKILCDEEKKNIINKYKFKKLRYRKELVARKNRNYHFDVNNIEETLRYLNLNKKIHQNGMISDTIFIILSLLLLLVSNNIIAVISTISLIVNSFSLFIDFECVNLQNYNIKRIENNKSRLENHAKKRLNIDIKNYGEASRVISCQLIRADTIPSSDEIVSNFSSLDELMQLRNFVLSYKEDVLCEEREKEGDKNVRFN